MIKFVVDLCPDETGVDFVKGALSKPIDTHRVFTDPNALLSEENLSFLVRLPIDEITIDKGYKNSPEKQLPMNMTLSFYDNVPTIIASGNIFDYVQARRIKKLADTYGIEIGAGQNRELLGKLSKIRNSEECSKCIREYCREPTICETYPVLEK